MKKVKYHPLQRVTSSSSPWLWLVGCLLLVGGVAIVVAVILTRSSSSINSVVGVTPAPLTTFSEPLTNVTEDRLLAALDSWTVIAVYDSGNGTLLLTFPILNVTLAPGPLYLVFGSIPGEEVQIDPADLDALGNMVVSYTAAHPIRRHLLSGGLGIASVTYNISAAQPLIPLHLINGTVFLNTHSCRQSCPRAACVPLPQFLPLAVCDVADHLPAYYHCQQSCAEQCSCLADGSRCQCEVYLNETDCTATVADPSQTCYPIVASTGPGPRHPCERDPSLCGPGFRCEDVGSSYACVDINECVAWSHPCLDTCLNTVGSFLCLNCSQAQIRDNIDMRCPQLPIFLLPVSNGALGGITGANARCQQAAWDAQLPGSGVVAILAQTLFAYAPDLDGSLPIVLRNGTVFAHSFADLTEGFPMAGDLNILVNGTAVHSTWDHWQFGLTGWTYFEGGCGNCQGWTSSSRYDTACAGAASYHSNLDALDGHGASLTWLAPAAPRFGTVSCDGDPTQKVPVAEMFQRYTEVLSVHPILNIYCLATNPNCSPGTELELGESAAQCLDINECEMGTHSCTGDAPTCVNTNGSFTCLCDAGAVGWRWNALAQVCEDVDECAEHTADCDIHATCTNTNGSYTCGECQNGWIGPGTNCTDVNECEQNPDGLCLTEFGYDCINTPGSYQCLGCRYPALVSVSQRVDARCPVVPIYAQQVPLHTPLNGGLEQLDAWCQAPPAFPHLYSAFPFEFRAFVANDSWNATDFLDHIMLQQQQQQQQQHQLLLATLVAVPQNYIDDGNTTTVQFSYRQVAHSWEILANSSDPTQLLTFAIDEYDGGGSQIGGTTRLYLWGMNGSFDATPNTCQGWFSDDGLDKGTILSVLADFEFGTTQVALDVPCNFSTNPWFLCSAVERTNCSSPTRTLDPTNPNLCLYNSPCLDADLNICDPPSLCYTTTAGDDELHCWTCEPGFEPSGESSLFGYDPCVDINECLNETFSQQCTANQTCTNTPGSWHCQNRVSCEDTPDACAEGLTCVNTITSYACVNCTVDWQHPHLDLRCPNQYPVFLLPVVNGHLGGAAGIDRLCQQAAWDAQLPGSEYTALTTAMDRWPVDEFDPNPLVMRNGKIWAFALLELFWSPQIPGDMNVLANGTAVVANSQVWPLAFTGYTAPGGSCGDCQGWTSDSPYDTACTGAPSYRYVVGTSPAMNWWGGMAPQFGVVTCDGNPQQRVRVAERNNLYTEPIMVHPQFYLYCVATNLNCSDGTEREVDEVAARCVDLNECALGTHNCGGDASLCINTNGSFFCACGDGPGFRWNASLGDCEDIDECAEHLSLCDDHAPCINTEGSYECGSCIEGMTGDGFNCTDINECEENPNICNRANGFECVNILAGYNCLPCRYPVAAPDNIDIRCPVTLVYAQQLPPNSTIDGLETLDDWCQAPPAFPWWQEAFPFLFRAFVANDTRDPLTYNRPADPTQTVGTLANSVIHYLYAPDTVTYAYTFRSLAQNWHEVAVNGQFDTYSADLVDGSGEQDAETTRIYLWGMSTNFSTGANCDNWHNFSDVTDALTLHVTARGEHATDALINGLLCDFATENIWFFCSATERISCAAPTRELDPTNQNLCVYSNPCLDSSANGTNPCDPPSLCYTEGNEVRCHECREGYEPSGDSSLFGYEPCVDINECLDHAHESLCFRNLTCVNVPGSFECVALNWCAHHTCTEGQTCVNLADAPLCVDCTVTDHRQTLDPHCPQLPLFLLPVSNGSLGGYEGANRLCQQAAWDAQLVGSNYIAINDHLYLFVGGAPEDLPVVMPNQEVFATTLGDLIFNSQQLGDLNVLLNGSRVVSHAQVWHLGLTGSTAFGGSCGNCQGWTSASPYDTACTGAASYRVNDSATGHSASMTWMWGTAPRFGVVTCDGDPTQRVRVAELGYQYTEPLQVHPQLYLYCVALSQNCSEGTELVMDADSARCVDIDECALQLDECGDAAPTCVNTNGSYVCVCEVGSGFRWNITSQTCEDVDECTEQTHRCDAYAACNNTVGGYNCTECAEGFFNEGEQCVDYDECQTFYVCPDSYICWNTPGGHDCIPCLYPLIVNADQTIDARCPVTLVYAQELTNAPAPQGLHTLDSWCQAPPAHTAFQYLTPFTFRAYAANSTTSTLVRNAPAEYQLVMATLATIPINYLYSGGTTQTQFYSYRLMAQNWGDVVSQNNRFRSFAASEWDGLGTPQAGDSERAYIWGMNDAFATAETCISWTDWLGDANGAFLDVSVTLGYSTSEEVNVTQCLFYDLSHPWLLCSAISRGDCAATRARDPLNPNLCLYDNPCLDSETNPCEVASLCYTEGIEIKCWNCTAGYEASGDSPMSGYDPCRDVNECVGPGEVCSPGCSCMNTPGSYRCLCP